MGQRHGSLLEMIFPVIVYNTTDDAEDADELPM